MNESQNTLSAVPLSETASAARPVGCKSVAPETEFPLPPLLREFWVGIAVLTLIAWVVATFDLLRNRPESAGLFPLPGDLFGDFWHYESIFRYLHSSQFFLGAERFAYPAFSAVVYDLLYHLGPHRQAIYLGGELVLDGLAASLLFWKIRSLRVRLFPAIVFASSVLLFSYPLMMMLERANIEIFTCLLTAVGLWALVKKRDLMAAGFWGAAGALKIYPLVLLALFLSRQRWRPFVAGVAAFVAISVLAMWFVGPTIPIALAGSISGIGGFVSTYAQTVRTAEVGYDHSLLATFKIIGYVLAHHLDRLSFLTPLYIALAGTLALIVFFTRVTRLPQTNQLIVLFAAMVLLPPVSYDYTLVHLYAPWTLLVVTTLCAARTGTHVSGLRTSLLCFVVLFTPQNYLYYHWIHLSGTIKVAALVTLIVSMLRHPVPDEALRIST